MRRVLILALLLLLAGCNRQAEPELTTTTTDPGSTTTLEPEEGSSAGDGAEDGEDTETTDGQGASGEEAGDGPIESYEVVVRAGTDQGDVWWVLVPPGDHTQVDLEGLVAQVVDDAEAPLWGIHVFDDREAVDAGRVEAGARTDEEQALVDSHYLVSLSEGRIVRFEGPNEGMGEFVLGS